MTAHLNEIENKVINNEGIDRDLARELLDSTDYFELFSLTNRVRRKFWGDRISLCGIVNAKSGKCSENCHFCSQSAHYHTDIGSYPVLPAGQIIDQGEKVFSTGAQGFSIVTSGKQAPVGDDLDNICQAITGLDGHGYGRTYLCSSLGLLQRRQAERLKQAGLKRYHHNLETSREFFPNICNTHSFAERVETIKTAQAAGLEVCSGGIFGLGETWEDRISLAIELRELQVRSIPLNFLNPIPGTPMENQPPLSAIECLKIIALYRFINPALNITVCGGREKNLRDLQSWIFFAGANGMLIGNYLTTTGREIQDDLRMLNDLGLTY